MLTLTEIINKLKETQSNMMSDLQSDWIQESDKREMLIQLQLLNQSIANLELIHSQESSLLFSSSITR
jgi:hypothetical protein